jgi:hypothetical protein
LLEVAAGGGGEAVCAGKTIFTQPAVVLGAGTSPLGVAPFAALAVD